MKDTMKFPLQQGCCAGRWTCKNVNTKVCHPIPKSKDYILCDHYKKDKMTREEKVEILGKAVKKATNNGLEWTINPREWGYGKQYYAHIFDHDFAKHLGFKLKDLGAWCDEGKEPLEYIKKFI